MAIRIQCSVGNWLIWLHHLYQQPPILWMTKCSCNKFHSRKFYSNHCKPHFVIQKVSSFLKRTHTISLNRITHFAHKCDIQTAAMLCCAFGRHCPSADVSRSSSLSGKSLNGSVSYKCCKNLLERGQKIHIKCTKLTFSLIIYIYLFLFIWFFFCNHITRTHFKQLHS